MPTEKQIKELMKSRGCSRDAAILAFLSENNFRCDSQSVLPLRRNCEVRMLEDVGSTRASDDNKKKHKRFEIKFSSGTRVLRQGFFTEDFHEELSMEPEHVNLERFNSGAAPFLRNHNNDVNDVVGNFEAGSAKVDGNTGTAIARMSRRESINEFVGDLEDGIIRNISSGYSVQEFTELEERAPDGLKIFRATKWTPLEGSAVAVGAEGPGASVGAQRSNEKTYNCNFITRNIQTGVTRMKWTKEQIDKVMERHACDEATAKRMLDEAKSFDTVMAAQRNEQPAPIAQPTPTPAPVAQPAPTVDANTIRAEERKRIADINEACRITDFKPEEIQLFIDDNKTADAVRALVITRMADKDKSKPTSNLVIVGNDFSREGRREGIMNAILYRGHTNAKLKPELSEAGRDFAQLTLLEMARECVEANGIRTRRMSKRELVRAAFNSTSDFPELLANTANKSLRDAYVAFPQTFEPIVTRVENVDFKEVSSLQLGSMSLQEVLEDGEFKKTSFSEEAEKYKLKTFGKMIAITRQMIINDDLRGLTRIPAMMAEAAGQLESDLVWGQITSNPVMADGNALFSAAHKNLGAAGAISDVTLGEGRKLMRQQVDKDGQKINISSNWLVTPVTLETVGEKQVSAITPQQSSNVNPFGPGGRSQHGLISEPRLDDTSAAEYYQIASSDRIENIHLATLQGEPNPVIETEETFDVDGMKMKVRHDVVSKVVDFRGMVKHPG